jgi:predicted amidophosphoribosyltransferase
MLWQNPTWPEWTKDRSGQIIGAVVPHWLPLSVALMPAAFLWSRRRLRKPGSCPNCGYDLTGNASGRCSECGEACTKSQLHSSACSTSH